MYVQCIIILLLTDIPLHLEAEAIESRVLEQEITEGIRKGKLKACVIKEQQRH